MMPKKKVLTPDDQHQFTATEMWHRHVLNPKMLYTDGVQYFAENAGNGAYWLLDIMATELMDLHKKEPFLHIQMLVGGSAARIIADDGNGNEVWRREIEFTDCPEGVWRFYLTDNVLLLPSEY
jgi:hypothetical protein